MPKHKLVLSLLGLLSLSACETTTSIVCGLNSDTPSISFQKATARDAVSEISSLYLPAHSKILITQNIKDAFGEEFSTNLRQKGFSVNEEKETKKKPSSKPKNILQLKYLLDGTGEGNWRLQLVNGSKIYTREYQELTNPTGFLPLGSWLLQENEGAAQ